MTANRDFDESVRSLNDQTVEFLVIGGVADNFDAPPRGTKDIDIWGGPERDNFARPLVAVERFGFPTASLTIAELLTEPRVLMLGVVPNRIDILTSPDGIEWASAWSRRVPARYGVTPIWIVSRRVLIASKRAAGRPRDLADVAMLESSARRGAT